MSNEHKTLCWGCQRDISTDVQFSTYGQWFCEDCNRKIREFLHGLRREGLEKSGAA